MIKTYISQLNGLNVPVKINGRSITISFDKCPISGCTFLTGNKQIQAALEAKPYFGTAYTIQENKPEVVEEVPEVKEPVQATVYSDITRLADAKAKLVELGADAGNIKKKADIIALAEQYNVSFPNLISRN